MKLRELELSQFCEKCQISGPGCPPPFCQLWKGAIAAAENFQNIAELKKEAIYDVILTPYRDNCPNFELIKKANEIRPYSLWFDTLNRELNKIWHRLGYTQPLPPPL